jgi:uridine kinase
METNAVIVVGVAGGSGSGKKSFSRRLAEELGAWCSIMSLDNFYKDLTRTYSEANFDHPDALDFEELISCVSRLRQGSPVMIPVYDLQRGVRIDSRVLVEPKSVVIVEGVLALWEPRLRALMDLKVFVKVDDDERLARRIIKDTIERGLKLADVLSQYRRFAKPSYDDFVLPSMRFADVIVPRGGENDVALQIVSTVLPNIKQHDVTVS